MILGVTDDGDPAAVGTNRFALGNALNRVVRAFAVHVWLQQLEQR